MRILKDIFLHNGQIIKEIYNIKYKNQSNYISLKVESISELFCIVC
jgi:hypothetical protein